MLISILIDFNSILRPTWGPRGGGQTHCFRSWGQDEPQGPQDLHHKTPEGHSPKLEKNKGYSPNSTKTQKTLRYFSKDAKGHLANSDKKPKVTH